MSERILYLEPLGGIAGDMFLAAAADLGVNLETVASELASLQLDGWKFQVSRSQRHHLTGTHVDVLVEGGGPHVLEGHHPHHHHDHDHGDHHHDHGDHHHGEHEHRSLTSILERIARSRLSDWAKDKASALFRRIGAAEAKIHGVPLEEIAFHEVGAVDSIVDLCGAAVVLDLLGRPKVYASPPPLGSGKVRIAHGVVPVPVPATLELLKGKPVLFEGQGELTTPTGAALLAELATIAPPPPMVVEQIGYGVGTKDWADRANVLRASLGRASAGAQHEAVVVLEATIDDASPQLLGALLELVLERGALDAWLSPVTMKKSRPGHVLSVLALPKDRAALAELVVRESPSLGVRWFEGQRLALGRRFEPVVTRYGEVKMKLGLLGDQVVNAAPELEDCRALARAAGVPLKLVLAEAVAVWSARSPSRG